MGEIGEDHHGGQGGRTRRAASRGAAVLLLAVVAGAAGGQTSRPAASWPAQVSDAWLAQLAAWRLQEAARTGEYGTLKEDLSQALLGRLGQGGIGSLQPLTEVLYVIHAAEYLPRAEALPEGRKFAQWLAGNYQVSRLLFRTMAADLPRADGIRGMHAIWQAEPKLALEYANLAVAFATATPERAPGAQVDTADAVRAFRWYARECRGARFDVKKMPYELSRYLACTRLAVAERNWAGSTYGKELNADRIYNALTYDWDHVKKGTPKKIASLPFTLQNLKQVGGVCLERAYYSAEVLRAMAVPAAMVTGSGQRGGHAWLAMLVVTPGGRSARWDTATGRYAEDKYFVGSVYDPVRGGHMSDCELSISLASQLLPLAQREHAAAAVLAARMVEKAGGAGEEAGAANLAALKQLAEQYNLLLAGKSAATRPADAPRLSGPPVSVAGLANPRPLDERLVEELILHALNCNMVENPAWELVIDQVTKGRLPADRVGKFVDELLARTAREHPDYGCSRALRLIATFPNPAQRATLLGRAAKVFAQRADLAGQISIAEGKAWMAVPNEKAAMAAYLQAAQAAHNNAPGVVMEAMKLVEDIHRGKNQLGVAIDLYYRLYQQAGRMDMASPWRTSGEKYRLGSRLVELLKEAGKTAASQKIAAEIDPPQAAGKDKGGKKS